MRFKSGQIELIIPDLWDISTLKRRFPSLLPHWSASNRKLGYSPERLMRSASHLIVASVVCSTVWEQSLWHEAGRIPIRWTKTYKNVSADAVLTQLNKIKECAAKSTRLMRHFSISGRRNLKCVKYYAWSLIQMPLVRSDHGSTCSCRPVVAILKPSDESRWTVGRLYQNLECNRGPCIPVWWRYLLQNTILSARSLIFDCSHFRYTANSYYGPSHPIFISMA